MKGAGVEAANFAVGSLLGIENVDDEEERIANLEKLVSNPEPALREVGLRSLIASQGELEDALEASCELQRRLIRTLTDVAVADEKLRNRLAACTAVGRAIPSLNDPHSKSKAINACGKVAFKLFCQIFDSENIQLATLALCAFAPFCELGDEQEVEQRVERLRTEALKVLGLACEYASVFRAQKSLRHSIELGDDENGDQNNQSEPQGFCHPLLVACILRCLRVHFVDTRKRRETLIHPILHRVHQLFISCTDRTFQNLKVHPAIREEGSWFICKWWQMPADSLVRSLPLEYIELLESTHGENHLTPSLGMDDELKDLLRRANEARVKTRKPSRADSCTKEHKVSAMVGKSSRLSAIQSVRAPHLGPKGGYIARRYKYILQQEKSRLENVGEYEIDEDLIEDTEEKTNDGDSPFLEDFGPKLVFNISRNMVVFSGSSNSQTLQLTNQTDSAEIFTIQTHPSEFFYVAPAYGVVPPNSSFPVQLHFVPQPKRRKLERTRINGFLRIRNANGFPGQRLSLSAFHGPLLRVFDTQIDFGYFPFISHKKKGSGRVLPFFVTNESTIACNCSILLSTDDSAFSISRPFHLILPGQTIKVDIFFQPSEPKRYAQVLHVSGVGGESHRVELKGHGGDPLEMKEDQIDFSHILDPLGSVHTKMLQLENLDETMSLSVNFKSSDPNQLFASDIVLKPREVKLVEISLCPHFCGELREELTVFATDSKPKTIKVSAFIGNPVCFPYFRDMYLPVQTAGVPNTMELPLSNCTLQRIEFSIEAFGSAAFTFSLRSEKSGRSSPVQPSSTFSLESKETQTLLVRFSSAEQGFFRASIRVEMFFPNRLSLGPWYVMCPCVGETEIPDFTPTQQPMSYGELLRLVSTADSENAFDDVGSIDDNDSEMGNPNPSLTFNDPPVLRLSKTHVALYGSGSIHVRKAPIAEIELRNTTGVAQEFVILTSKPFYLSNTSGVDCFLEPHERMPLHVRIDTTASEEEFPFLGFLTVLIKPSNRLSKISAVCSATLFGSKDNVIAVSANEGTISIPGCVVNQVETRSITIRNLSSREVKISSSIQLTKEASPFVFENSRDVSEELQLAPWQSETLSILFHPKVHGTFAAPIHISYVNPFAADDEVSTNKQLVWQSAHSCMLEAVASHAEVIEITPDDLIDFGEISIGRKVTKPINMENLSRQNVSILASVLQPFSLSHAGRFVIPRAPISAQSTANQIEDTTSGDDGTLDLQCTFAPRHQGSILRFASFVIDNDFANCRTLALRARAGLPRLISNYGYPFETVFAQDQIEEDEGNYLELSESSEGRLVISTGNTVDFGVIFTYDDGIAKRELVIRNNGTRAIVISDISSTSENLKWAVKPFSISSVVGIKQAQVESILESAKAEILSGHSNMVVEETGNEGEGEMCSMETSGRTEEQPSIDWDEMDFLLSKTCADAKEIIRDEISKSRETKAKKKRRRVKSGEIALDRMETESGIGAHLEESAHALGTLTALMQERQAQSGACSFPFTLGRSKELRLQLSYSYDLDEVGEFMEDIQIDFEDHGAEEGSFFLFRVVGRLQPPLELNCDESYGLDFGVVGVGNLSSQVVELKNPGLERIGWSVALEEFGSKLLQENQVIENDVEDTPNQSIVEHPAKRAFSVIPPSGHVEPGRTEKVKVMFAPGLFATGQILSCLVKLNTIVDSEVTQRKSFEMYFPVSAKAGIAEVHVSQCSKHSPKVLPQDQANSNQEHHFKFGGVKTGTQKNYPCFLRNDGNMDASFRVESHSQLFVVSPSEGMIKPNEEIEVNISFGPLSDKVSRSKISVYWLSENRAEKGQRKSSTVGSLAEAAWKEIELVASGSGGQPHLEIKQTEVDFGCAILGIDNQCPFTLYNTGTAETLAAFKFPGQNISIHDSDGVVLDVVTVPSKSSRTVQIVFKPNQVMDLQGVMIVYSLLEGEGKYHVELLASVGVPELTVTPERALDYLDFDVALIKQTHVRSFTVTNVGDVDLPFKCIFLQPTLSAIERAQARKRAPKPKEKRLLGKNLQQRGSIKPETKEPDWLELYNLDTDMEEFIPSEISVEPKEGVFRKGMMVHFTVSFEPKEREVLSQAILSLQNQFKSIYAEITGIGGDPLLELDTPNKVIDFGLCQIGETYTKTINVMNAGNVCYLFRVLPDPNDLLMRAYMTQLGWDGDYANLTKLSEPSSLDKDERHDKEIFERALSRVGFSFTTSGFCDAYATSPLKLEFRPTERLQNEEKKNAGSIESRIHIRHATGYEQITLRGRLGQPLLGIYDLDSTPFIDPVMNLGTCPIHQIFRKQFLLHNSGKVAAMFLVKRNLPQEIRLTPLEGSVAPGEYLPMELEYLPYSNIETDFTVDFLYNGHMRLQLHVLASGGCGVLEAEFLSERDKNLHGLDFQLVSTAVPVEKRLLIHNKGQVALKMIAETTTPQYSLQRIGNSDVQFAGPGYVNRVALLGNDNAPRILSESKLKAPTPSRKFNLQRNMSKLEVNKPHRTWNGSESPVVECVLKPGEFAILRVVLYAEREIMYTSLLKVRSEFDSISVPLRARGGVVHFKHSGDLDFGSIACDHTYTRKIQLFNSGTIPTGVELYWKMSFGSREANEIAQSGDISATVLLRGTSTRLGRVRLWQWAVTSILAGIRQEKEERRLSAPRGTKLQRMGTQQKMTRRGSISKQGSVSTFGMEELDDETPVLDGLKAVGDLVESRVTRILERFAKHQDEQEKMQDMSLEKIVKAELSSGGGRNAASGLTFKVTKGQWQDMTIQERFEKELEESNFSIPHVHVTPRSGTLSQRLSLELAISFNCSKSGPFSAALVVASSLPGIPTYEIPIKAVAQEVMILVDDPSTINFGRQALGEFKSISRTFTNKGNMPATFRVRNYNVDLSVEPMEGELFPGQSIKLDFLYTPSSESLCSYPVYFETNCTAPLVIDIYAGGGNPELDLDNYEKFDFGRCMVGKSIPKQLRIGNSGNAVLTITGFQFQDSRGTSPFEKGESWPHGLEVHNPMRIMPAESYYLPLIFHPSAEDKFECEFTIHTTIGSHSIELVGMGREAVLSLSVSRVEFVDCIVGNAYQNCFEVSNAGDLNYPLEAALVHFQDRNKAVSSEAELEGDIDWSILDDLKVEPKKMKIAPFEKQIITVTYIPTKTVSERSGEVRISLSSIYSNFEIPLKIIAGTADLVVDPPHFDFAHFERSKAAERVITLSNAGSMTFGFRIKRASNGLFPFKLSRWEATLGPGDSVPIACTYLHKAIPSLEDGVEGLPRKVNGRTQQEFGGEFSEELLIETDLVGSLVFVNVKGNCDTSTLNPEEFSQVKLGHCTVGELVTRVVVITNKGGYPAEVKLHPSYPLKVFPKSLEIAGRGSASFSIQWRPMGSYELRSVVKLHSNVGQFECNVTGVGVYPRFRLEGNRMDFGICSPNISYQKSFTIRNTGKVLMDWSIPAVADGYSVSQTSGTLEVREEVEITVTFTPLDVGRYPGDFIVESRGRYKIVSVVGVGGLFKVDLSPKANVDFGSLPCGGQSNISVKLVNLGGVKSNFGWRSTSIPSSSVASIMLVSPPSFRNDGKLLLDSNSSVEVVFAVNPRKSGVEFAFSGEFFCHEGVVPFSMKGSGSVIELRAETRNFLLNEKLESQSVPNPLVLAFREYEETELSKDSIQELNPALETLFMFPCLALQPDPFLELLEAPVHANSSSFEELLLPPLPFINQDEANEAMGKRVIGPILEL